MTIGARLIRRPAATVDHPIVCAKMVQAGATVPGSELSHDRLQGREWVSDLASYKTRVQDNPQDGMRTGVPDRIQDTALGCAGDGTAGDEAGTDRGDSWVQVYIGDTGIGMSESEIRIALTPFARVDQNPLVRTREGTGLGLPITKALVEAQGAEFMIESLPGKGTVISLMFPVAG